MPLDDDGGIDFLQHGEDISPHVAGIGLDLRLVASCGQNGGRIVKDPSIAAIGLVPQGISLPRGMREFLVVARHMVLQWGTLGFAADDNAVKSLSKGS